MNILPTILLTIVLIASVLFIGALFLIGSARTAGGLRRSRFTSSKNLPWYANRVRSRLFGERCVAAANEVWPFSGTHRLKVGRIMDNNVTTRYLLAKDGVTPGSTADIAGVTDRPLGVWTDEGLATEKHDIELFGISDRTLPVIANGAIAAGVDVYGAANGQVSVAPTVVGTYYRIGKSLTATANAGEELELDHYAPVKVKVVAKPASVQNATTAAVDLTTSEALANALKANYNTLQSDFASLVTALTSDPCEIIFLAA